ncbi:MAG: NAD(P)H-quinone oxidoreductase subunit L [Coleofasciculaceae cyanobacterium SM2_1_6]|nr:NAD(P)H-quinone oxidoreductase subunit L [Coleofasciculaceae cyanobacterium SM2_1_6]
MEITSTITLLLYVVLAGTYLAVVPLLTYAYLKARWYVASSWERGFMYFLVFFFFPGLLLLSPLLNFRPQRRQIPS